MSIEQNKNMACHFFAAQDQNKGPLDEAICAATYTASIAGSPTMDIAGHNQFAQMFYAAFPDIHHIINDTVADEEKAVVRFTLEGTHQGSFLGIPASGKAISISAIAMMEFVDGKITRLNGVFDQMGLLRQIGVLPG